MESDKHLYEIFEANPEWLFELTGRISPGPSKFVSVTVKAIEKRADGVIIPEAVSEPILVTELQMWSDSEIYYRIVIEMAFIQSENAGRSVEGLILFGTKEQDPRTEPWKQVVTAYYLDELIERLSVRSPAHPLVAVFQPLLEKNAEFLERNAAEYYNQIVVGATDDRQRTTLLSVFLDWMLQRFSERGKQEIENMLIGQLPDLRDTQAGKDLIAIGVKEGIKEGIEKGIQEGIEKGIEKGALIGAIQTCARILSMEQLPEEELLAKTIAELEILAQNYQDSVRDRIGTN